MSRSKASSGRAQRLLSRFGFWLEKYLGALVVLLLGATWQYRVEGDAHLGGRYLFIFWHREIIPLLYSRRRQGIAVMISSSKDGQLVAGPAEALGYRTVRGSATRGGGRALRQMVKLARTCGLNIVPDGPKGPAQVVKDGVVWAGHFTQLPIVCVSAQVNRAWVLRTWDRMLIPKPFARITVRYAPPIPAPSREEVQNTLDTVQQVMESVHQ